MTALGSIAKNYNHGPLTQANQMLVDKSSLALQCFLISRRTQKWVTLQKFKGLVHLKNLIYVLMLIQIHTLLIFPFTTGKC